VVTTVQIQVEFPEQTLIQFAGKVRAFGGGIREIRRGHRAIRTDGNFCHFKRLILNRSPEDEI
jgi:hypothetical protein